MKHVFTKSLLLVAAVVSFSSCNKDGGGGGGQQANVPTVPGPQGNIYAQNDQNTIPFQKWIPFQKCWDFKI